MRYLNTLFTIYSFTALVIIIERLSPTTNILIQPYNFIRLHEINQTVIFLPVTIILSFFILKILTNNFHALQVKTNSLLIILFILGIYLYGAGEGWHEVASFTLNQYCAINNLIGNLCRGLFINDFYAGNIIFFAGAVFISISLMGFAAKQPMKNVTNKDITILLVNSIVYGFTWFAYAAFDKVLIGFLFSTILTIISFGFLMRVRSMLRKYPYLIYSAAAYSFATIATVLVRFH